MKINKVLDFYYNVYNKAGYGKEHWKTAIHTFKSAINQTKRPQLYISIRARILHLIAGRLYWPNTFPTAIDQQTAEFLYSIIRMTTPEVVIEIGTANGNSAIAIGQALEDNGIGKLYAIDPDKQELVLLAIKKAKLQKRIEYITDYSFNAIPSLQLKHVDFVFIDGDHSYENVVIDFNLVKNLLMPGGIIVFHDTIFHSGPKQFVQELQKEGTFDIITLPTPLKIKGDAATLDRKEGFIPAGLTICMKKIY